LSHGKSDGSSNWLKWLTMCAKPTSPITPTSRLKGALLLRGLEVVMGLS
jgi:hypothetical protein